MHESLMQKLDANGLKYSYQPGIEAADIPTAMKNCSVLVIRSKMRVDASIKRYAPELELIVRAGSGMDNLEVEALEKVGVQCLNCPEANRDAVAEQTIGTLLALSSNIVKGNRETSDHQWDREGNRGFEIGGKTVGIIGYGNTGSAVAQRLQSFNVRILAYDKYLSGFGSKMVEEVDIETLLNEADVISFHVPLTNETRDWINDDFFKRVKKQIVLLNLARGEIMETSAVLRALERKQIVALGVDVWPNEKLETWSDEEREEFDRIKVSGNVLITPHVAGWTRESYRRISEIAADKILAYFEKSIPFVKDEDNISDNT